MLLSIALALYATLGLDCASSLFYIRLQRQHDQKADFTKSQAYISCRSS
jgi:hypothetical protein